MAPSVLIAEDSATMRAFIVSTIEEIGDFNIVEAGSGFEALKALPRNKFDLIITDINMPDINGLELINFVKKNPSYLSIPLIIISTESSEKDREKGLALGADEYITKPFKPEELQNKVRTYLGDKIK